jgi:Icc-related predicted phosphoesterase
VIWQKGEPFRPEHAIELHKLTKKFLMQSLEEHVGKTVVVTHMAPHELSLSKSRNINLDAAYASNLEDLIFTYQPTLWIHGHIHESRDYRVGETRIVSNPRGYFGHGPFGGENMDFDSHKVVTI